MSARLPVIKAKDLVRLLQREGYILAHQKGSHATYKHPVTHRRVTVPVHPGRDLKRGLLRGILNDLNMTPEEFIKKF
jgi:predicted RNA binding protein YcfA (HicA-like mRNA interferase family)